MVSIVYEHCLDLHVPGDGPQNVDINVYYVESVSQVLAMPWIVQPMKFGTICFFIISGYLLGKHLSLHDSPWLYYKRRLQVVGVPFLIAFIVLLIKHLNIFNIATGHYDKALFTIQFVRTNVWLLLFNSAYWFIFSFLIALGVLLIFWKYSHKPVMGWITGCIAIFYGINIYFGWVEQRHNLATPAYIFYLWLGVWLSHREDVLLYIRQLPNIWLIGITLLSMYLAIWESRVLWEINSTTPFNTLRLSNQLFSVLVFLFLLRNDISRRLTWFNPRNESFGIYLYHLYFIGVVNLLMRSFNILTYKVEFTGLDLAGVTLLRWLIVYTLTLLFVKLVNKTRFRWLFGN